MPTTNISLQTDSRIHLSFDAYAGKHGRYAIIKSATLYQYVGQKEYEIDLSDQQGYVKDFVCTTQAIDYAFFSEEQAKMFDEMLPPSYALKSDKQYQY